MIWGTGTWGAGQYRDEVSTFTNETASSPDYTDESWGWGDTGWGDDWGDTLVVDPAYADESPITVPFTEE